uniref:Glycosyltransferase n=1 Tax=Plagiochasma appendiculatum TaxID=157224 RepID=A0A7G4WF16_9MARC|nr:UDP-glycosyltransferase 1 [Plagiochasma appendiculatum]
MARESRGKPHALLVPLSGQGHVAPLLTLGMRLADNGITITLAGFKKDVVGIKEKYGKQLQSLDFHLLELDHDPGVIDNVKVKPPHVQAATGRAMEPVLEKLEADRLAGRAIPSCIIADFFMFWSEDAAARLGMKRYVFYPSGVILAKMFQEVPFLLKTGKLQLGDDNSVIPFDGLVELPGIALVKYSDLPFSIRHLPLRLGSTVSASIVVNSFLDLELEPIKYYQIKSSSKQSQGKVYAVGPIVTPATFKDHAFLSATVTTATDPLSWLDTQPGLSVLYICLGSMVRLSPPQIMQLALALESLEEKCSFLWVLPRGNGNFEALEDVLPADFARKANGRGLVTTSWVPQVQVLAHPAILGFLSHCGWCSTIESMTSGVPMIAWPHAAEQFLNCRYIVDQLKVATEVVRGPDGVVEQKEFEKAFTVLLGDQGKQIKDRCKELKAKAAAAIAPGGSSENAFQQLIEEIKSLT